MGYVRSRRAICCWDLLHIIKIITPMIGYRTWIVQIGFVEFLYVRGVSTEEIRAISLILHHDAHLSSGFPNKDCG
jgi:hypothetical protein